MGREGCPNLRTFEFYHLIDRFRQVGFETCQLNTNRNNRSTLSKDRTQNNCRQKKEIIGSQTYSISVLGSDDWKIVQKFMGQLGYYLRDIPLVNNSHRLNYLTLKLTDQHRRLSDKGLSLTVKVDQVTFKAQAFSSVAIIGGQRVFSGPHNPTFFCSLPPPC